jgi:hypothetical protein
MPAPTAGTPVVQTVWRLDVDQDLVTGSGNWLQVKGAEALAPTIAPTTADTTDFDSVGWASSAVTLRGAQIVGTAQRKLYSSVRDPGQEFIRARSEDLALFHARIYERVSGGEAYDAWCTAQWVQQSGGPSDIVKADFTLLVQGARSVITNPFGVGSVPVISGVSPVTTPVAGGGIIQIFGSGFSTVAQVATNVKFGVTNVTAFVVQSDSVIIAVAPAKTAGPYQVFVTNTTGVSTTGGTPLTYV